MEREIPNHVRCHNLNDDDVMDVDREGSPATVVGDKDSPRLTPFTPEDTVGVVHSSAMPNSEAFAPDDYMTDEQFSIHFPGAERSIRNHQRNTGQTAATRIIKTFSANGKTFRRGKTVELYNGDFLRIVNVLEAERTGVKYLQGYPLQRLSKHQRWFDQHLNELTMVVGEENSSIQRNQSRVMEVEAVSNVLRIRDVIFTNAPYPSYSCREDPENSKSPRDFIRDHGRLVCRWVFTTFYTMRRRGRAWNEQSIMRLRADEVDTNSNLDDEHLRRRWRGSTSKGGSCAGWLPGERAFDMAERLTKRNVDNSSSNPEPSLSREHPTENPIGHRYTFGDAFCGAGGASRGAKAAGYRVDWGFDADEAAIHSYTKNFFSARCEAAPAYVFVSIIKENFRIDVLHISPPCQPYSPAHTRPGQNDEANQAALFAVGEIIKKTKPRVVTLENTFGLAERWPEWLNALVRIFTALGFSIRWRVFNLAEYGLPQARKRLIMFASCPGEKLPEYPQPTHGPSLLPFTTINDCIKMIPPGYPDHNPDGVIRGRLPPYNGDAPLRNCITTGGSLDVHPSGQRNFTKRELACLQLFPLEHRFGNVGTTKQIGNAVPPLVMQVFYSQIRRWLEEANT